MRDLSRRFMVGGEGREAMEVNMQRNGNGEWVGVCVKEEEEEEGGKVRQKGAFKAEQPAGGAAWLLGIGDENTESDAHSTMDIWTLQLGGAN